MPPVGHSSPVWTSTLRGGSWVRVTLDQPKGNILTTAMLDALRRALDAARGSRAVKLLTIEGAGSHFSYGASIEEHTPDRVEDLLPALHGLLRDLFDAPFSTAAIVRGRCLGGAFEVVLACDFVFAAEDAQLGLPEISLGVFPPAAAALLPLRVGPSRASHSIILGDALPAAWWSAAGLVEQVAPGDRLEDAVAEWFDRYFAPRSALALRHAAGAARAALRHAFETTLPALEREYLVDLARSHDGVEGVRAFLERRPPRWRDA